MKLADRKAFDLVTLSEEGQCGNTPALGGIFVYDESDSVSQVQKLHRNN